MTNIRNVQQVIHAHATSDGDGVKISRVAGFNNAKFSPFLMVDELKSDESKDYVGGFPPHPHRGIETLTYMMQGHFQHKDHMGNTGELRSGGAQWMAAGRGVIHSEMPVMEEGALHGFQIWINQPAKDKMTPARYHDFQPETIYEHRASDLGLVRVIAGNIQLKDQVIQGPLSTTGVPLSVADWKPEAGGALSYAPPETHNVMVYVYQGELTINDQVIHQGQLALLPSQEALPPEEKALTPLEEADSNESWVSMQAAKNSGALLFSGEPLNEPVVHYGPFVMNSMQEIEQTIQDYNNGLFETY